VIFLLFKIVTNWIIFVHIAVQIFFNREKIDNVTSYAGLMKLKKSNHALKHTTLYMCQWLGRLMLTNPATTAIVLSSRSQYNGPSQQMDFTSPNRIQPSRQTKIMPARKINPKLPPTDIEDQHKPVHIDYDSKTQQGHNFYKAENKFRTTKRCSWCGNKTAFRCHKCLAALCRPFDRKVKGSKFCWDLFHDPAFDNVKGHKQQKERKAILEKAMAGELSPVLTPITKAKVKGNDVPTSILNTPANPSSQPRVQTRLQAARRVSSLGTQPRVPRSSQTPAQIPNSNRVETSQRQNPDTSRAQMSVFSIKRNSTKRTFTTAFSD